MNLELEKSLISHLGEFVSEKRKERIELVLNSRTRYFSLLLDDVFQAHNASAVVRSCDCFGVQDLYVIEGRNSFNLSNDVNIGSSKWISIYKHNATDRLNLLRSKKKAGFRLVSTVLSNRKNDLTGFDVTKGPFIIMVGTELSGLSEESISMADETIYLPMQGFSESLNLSVFSGILLENLKMAIQDKVSETEWKIDERDKIQLRLEWYKKSVKGAEKIVENFLKH